MDKKDRFVIFYYLHGYYTHVYVNAVDLPDAFAYANSFASKSGAIIVGVCLENLLNVWKLE